MVPARRVARTGPLLQAKHFLAIPDARLKPRLLIQGRRQQPFKEFCHVYLYASSMGSIPLVPQLSCSAHSHSDAWVAWRRPPERYRHQPVADSFGCWGPEPSRHRDDRVAVFSSRAVAVASLAETRHRAWSLVHVAIVTKMSGWAGRATSAGDVAGILTVSETGMIRNLVGGDDHDQAIFWRRNRSAADDPPKGWIRPGAKTCACRGRPRQRTGSELALRYRRRATFELWPCSRWHRPSTGPA